MGFSPTEIADLRTSISRAYERSPNDLGWRFLYSPASVLKGSRVALVGLNPGGHVNETDHAVFSSERGSAYRIESWHGRPPGKAGLQVQVLSVFARLGVEPDSVLAGNLIPFRSPSWSALRDKEQALEFGKSLWTLILNRLQPELIISLGGPVRDAMVDMLNIHDQQDIPINWGTQRALVAATPYGRLVSVPHLSQYKFVNRAESAEAVKRLFPPFE